MTVRRTLGGMFRGRRTDDTAADRAATPAARVDASTIQVFAHTLIADLFAVGLRVQNLGADAPEDLRAELEQVTDQIDKAIHDLREFAFGHRAEQ